MLVAARQRLVVVRQRLVAAQHELVGMQGWVESLDSVSVMMAYRLGLLVGWWQGLECSMGIKAAIHMAGLVPVLLGVVAQ